MSVRVFTSFHEHVEQNQIENEHIAGTVLEANTCVCSAVHRTLTSAARCTLERAVDILYTIHAALAAGPIPPAHAHACCAPCCLPRLRTPRPFYELVVKHNIYSMELVAGGLDGGPAGDTVDEYVVYIYCSILRPFYRAEQFHMFHPNLVLNRPLTSEYSVDARQAALDRGWIDQTCSEAGAANSTSTNREAISKECSTVCLANGLFLDGVPQLGCKAATEAAAALAANLALLPTVRSPGKGLWVLYLVLVAAVVAGVVVYLRRQRGGSRRRTYDISVQEDNDDDGDEDEDALVD